MSEPPTPIERLSWTVAGKCASVAGFAGEDLICAGQYNTAVLLESEATAIQAPFHIRDSFPNEASSGLLRLSAAGKADQSQIF